MKTPMQEHIEWMQEKLRILVEYRDLSAGTEVDECIQHAESMLEKEKEYFMGYGYKCCLMTKQKNAWSLETLFNETFNTKEK